MTLAYADGSTEEKFSSSVLRFALPMVDRRALQWRSILLDGRFPRAGLVVRKIYSVHQRLRHFETAS